MLRKRPNFALTELNKTEDKMKRMRKWLAVCPALATVLCACGGGAEQPSAPLRTVVLTAPVPEGGQTVKTLYGVVREASEVNLGFKTPGQISRICVKEGDHVRKGQLVAQLDDADYKLGVEAAQIQFDQLSREVERMERLHESKSLAGNDYDKALAGLRQVEVQLKTNRNKLDYTHLYAPASGVVQSVNFEPSEMVDAGTPVVVLMESGRFEVEADMPQDVYMRLGSLAGATCRAAFDRDGAMPVSLAWVVPKADGSQLYKARLVFDGKADSRLTAGMNVEVDLQLADSTAGSRYVLPLHALFQEKGRTFVWTVGNDSVVRRVAVNVVRLEGTEQAVVEAGLKGNERIVRAGVNALREGEKVRILAEPSATNVGGLL